MAMSRRATPAAPETTVCMQRASPRRATRRRRRRPGRSWSRQPANTASSIVTLANRNPWDNAAFVPAGLGGVGYDDRPLTYALDDAKAAAIAAMTADTSVNRTCRNTVVVLITSGKDSGDSTYLASHNVATTASSFLSVTASGTTKRVPIVVVGVKPAAADEAQLQSIATNSGGFYRKVTTVSEVTSAINRAVQLGFVRAADLDAGKSSEFVPVSPVIGSVNLEGASSASGSPLANTDITATSGGQHLPQRSNFMVTAGFSLPGFDGAVRAFRTYAPETDSTKPTGWKFSKDGTRLWPDLDGRPSLAGMARTVSDPNTRNIYTYLPDGSGGGIGRGVQHVANAASLATHLGVTDATSLITTIRAQPLGAMIGSTPALMDAPSLDPPPDNDYGFPDSIGTFAGDHKDRRSILFFGANDGMIHAVDARTGFEVWAFIPVQPATEAKDAARRSAGGTVRFLRRQLAEDRRGQAGRRLAIAVDHGGGRRRNVLSDVRRDRSGYGRRAGRGRTLCGQRVARQVRRAERVDRVQVGVPELLELQSSLLRDVHCFGRHVGRQGQAVWRPQIDSGVRREDRRVHMVGSRRRHGGQRADDDRRHRRVGLLPRHRDIDSRASGRTEGGERHCICSMPTRERRSATASGATCPTIASGSGSGSGCVNIGDVSNGRKNALQADPTAAGNNGSFVVESRVSRRYRRQVLALHVHVGRQHVRACHDGHEPADLRIVCPAVRRQHRRLHLLRDWERPAAGDCPRWNRHLQALWSEGQLPVSGRRAVHPTTLPL